MRQNKIAKMDEFLLFMADLAKQNPHIREFQRNDIYRLFVRQGVPQNEREIFLDVEGFFDGWIRHFNNKENISVFVDDSWQYFCQFRNKEMDVMTKKEQIKMYIPLDYKHIYNGATMLFEFLSDNDIAHQSKIGRNIRFDDIVIRVGNEKDAKKILDFINSNSYIQEGLIHPNPFAVAKDNIAFASDGKLSYNTVVCSYIKLYINEKIKNKELNSVNFIDFIKTSAQRYKTIFSKENFMMVEDVFEARQEVDRYIFNNYKDVSKLFFSQCSPEYSFNDYISYYRNKVGIVDEDFENLKETFKEAYIVMSLKYGNNHAFKGLERCFEQNNYASITKDNNIRWKLLSGNFGAHLNYELKKRGIDFQSFVLSVKRSILDDALISTYKKYGDSNSPLLGLLKESYYKAFTREYGSRRIVEACISPQDAYNIVAANYQPGITLDNMVSDYSENTIKKYNQVYGGSQVGVEAGKQI